MTRTISRRYSQTPGSVAMLCLTATEARQIRVDFIERQILSTKTPYGTTIPQNDYRRPPSLSYEWRLHRGSSGCTHVITGRGFEGKTCRKGRVTWSLLTRGMDARAAGCGHTSVKKLNNQLIITVQERWGGVWDLAASLDPVHFRVLRAAVITSWSSRRVREQFQKLRKPTAVICGSKCFFFLARYLWDRN